MITKWQLLIEMESLTWNKMNDKNVYNEFKKLWRFKNDFDLEWNRIHEDGRIALEKGLWNGG